MEKEKCMIYSKAKQNETKEDKLYKADKDISQQWQAVDICQKQQSSSLNACFKTVFTT